MWPIRSDLDVDVLRLDVSCNVLIYRDASSYSAAHFSLSMETEKGPVGCLSATVVTSSTRQETTLGHAQVQIYICQKSRE